MGIASPSRIKSSFVDYVATPNFIGFLILGQAVFSFFMAMNWRAGMAVERERWYGTLELLLLAPTSRITILMAEATFGLLDSGWMVFVTTLVAVFLFGTSFTFSNPLYLTLSFLLTLAAMMGLGLFFSAFYVLTRSAGPTAIAIQQPMRFFTGASFPLAALPIYLQYVSYSLPVTYGMMAVRNALLGLGSELGTELAYLTAFTLGFFLVGTWLIRIMERLAKTRGMLHTF